MNRNGIFNAIVVALAFALGGCGGEAPATSAATEAATAGKELREVRFNMSWLPQGSMAGVFAAMERGFYAEEGIAVEAMRGFGGIRTVNELDQGMFEFGYADPLAVMLNRKGGGRTRMVSALNQQWPAGLCFVRGRHAITTPADLVGLRIGGGQNSPMQVLLPAWLRANGVDPAGVELLQLDPAVVAASVVEGRIDAGECWLGNSLPVYNRRAAEAGVEIDVIEYRDFGLDMYGSGLVTSERLIEAEPELVAGFVRATLRGYAWAREHPAEATAMLLAHHPALDREITLQQLEEVATLLGEPAMLGQFEDARLASTVAFLDAAYALQGAVTAEHIFTTRFLATP